MKASYIVSLCFSSVCLVGASCAPGTDDAASSASTGQSLPAGTQASAGIGSNPNAGAGGAPSIVAAGVGGRSGNGIDQTRSSPAAAASSAGMTAAAGSVGRVVNSAAGRGEAGSGGAFGSAGTHANAGMMSESAAGTAAASSGGGPCGSGTPTDGRPTTGPLACIVEQHNATRAMVKTSMPLDPVTWDAELAKYAQEWTDKTCMSPQHRNPPMLNGKPLGENLYASIGIDATPGKKAVDGWSGEVACYTFGGILTTEKCDMKCTNDMHSDGCGHYTQVVWRASTKIGCGVTTCGGTGVKMQTEVICNYAPAGNIQGMNPY